MPSNSAPSLRNRAPLASLPLSLFVPAANSLPSPISLPVKRNAPTSFADGSSSSTPFDSPEKVKHRRLSRDVDPMETIKRLKAREITPKARSILDHDDLGVGKSPARRLFMDSAEGTSLGIVGAVPAPRSPLSEPHNRSLAPSPPIKERSGFDIPIGGAISSTNGADMHDPGFSIHIDFTSTSVTPFGTPDSARPRVAASNPITLALDAAAHMPSSPASSNRSYGSLYNEDQENIPPSLSTTSSPSKSSSLASPVSKHSQYAYNDEVFGSGSRARRHERSKLGLESVLGAKEDVGEGEELTPGRRALRRRDVVNGKSRMAREVDRI